MNAGWMNGKILDEKEMVLPVRDLGVLRGYGVFDFLRTYKKKPFHLEDHMVRLQHSASEIGMTIPYSLEELEKAMIDLLDYSDQDEVGLRIVCTGGFSRDSLTSKEGCNLFILMDPLKKFPPEYYRNGVKIITYKHMRFQPEAKSLNYIPAMEAMQEADEKGAVEALYCDEKGRLLEGTTSNVFIRKQGFWYTPGRDVLKGVTRQVIMNLIDPAELKAQDIHIGDLDGAEEVFITSSSKEIVPVTQVDELRFGDGAGPETKKLMQSFRQYVDSPEKWGSHGSL